MRDPEESKARDVDREARLSGKWTGIGFVIIILGVVVAVLLLLMGSA